jgi:hypothetical protein
MIAFQRHVAAALARHLGEDFAELLQGLLVGLAVILATVLAATAAGALVGGAIGSIVPGAGTAAGAGLGARIGFQAALAILEWLGVAFLIVYVADHLGGVGKKLAEGVQIAWDSRGSAHRLDAAARAIADGIGVFFSLLVQGIIAYLIAAARAGKLAGALKALRESRLFRSVAGFEEWLIVYAARQRSPYQTKTGVKLAVFEGGAQGASTVARSLESARALLQGLLVNRVPKFKSIRELDAFLRSRGFKLIDNQPYGPKLPDARQLIYQGPDNIIVKIKTRGYAGGPNPRSNGTMSVEITDGKGIEWENTLFKLDSDGRIIAKNILGKDTNMVPTRDGVLIEQAPGKFRVGKDGKPLPLAPWEVIEGGKATPINKDAFANRGHHDFLPGFDPTGASALK